MGIQTMLPLLESKHKMKWKSYLLTFSPLYTLEGKRKEEKKEGGREEEKKEGERKEKEKKKKKKQVESNKSYAHILGMLHAYVWI